MSSISRPLYLLLIVLLLVSGFGLAQELVPGRILITAQDSSQFPTIHLNFILTNNQSQPITDTTTLRVTENGLAVANLQLETVPAGLDLVFVVDANSYIDELDGSDQTRLQKAETIITNFANSSMDRTGLDRVSLIVPDEADSQKAQLLLDGASERGEVTAALTNYNPVTLADTPLQAMMSLALSQLADTQEEGRFQAVVLFTDGGTVDQQIDEELLLADPGRAVIFALILGAQAQSNEIVNVKRLYEPTNGFYWHTPDPADAAPLFERLQANRSQYQLGYHSNAEATGRYTVQITAGDLSDSTSFELQLGPPELQIELTTTAIQRIGDQPDTPLNELQPGQLAIPVQLIWGDNLPLDLLEAVLLVNGQVQAGLSAPLLSRDGRLTLNWDIANLEAGSYQLAVRITDALGANQESEPVTVTIDLVRPDLPTATPLPVPTPTPALPVVLPEKLNNSRFLVAAAAGGLGLLIMGLLLRRRRRRQQGVTDGARQVLNERLQELELWEPDLGTAPAGTAPNPLLALDDTPPQPAGAYLDVLQNGPEYTNPIPLSGDNITLGHDAQLVQIAFSDKSVSRLHARIRRRGSDYWLYDEGSATGTYLNFERIGLAPRLLENGSELHLGRVRLRFRLHQ